MGGKPHSTALVRLNAHIGANPVEGTYPVDVNPDTIVTGGAMKGGLLNGSNKPWVLGVIQGFFDEEQQVDFRKDTLTVRTKADFGIIKRCKSSCIY